MPLRLTLLLLAYCTSFSAVLSAQSDTCDAPVPAYRLSIEDPSCDQRWSYHLYRDLTIKLSAATREMLDAKERNALTLRNTVRAFATLSEGIWDVFNETDAALRALNEASTQANIVALLPVDNPSDEFQLQVAELTAELIKEFGSNAIKGSIATPHAQIIKLGTDIGTLWKIENIVKKRHTHIIAQDYLGEHYRFGGNTALLHKTLGISANASLEEAIKAFAARKGYYSGRLRKDYRLEETVQRVRAFQDIVTTALSERAAKQISSNPTKTPDELVAEAHEKYQVQKATILAEMQGDIAALKTKHQKEQSIINTQHREQFTKLKVDHSGALADLNEEYIFLLKGAKSSEAQARLYESYSQKEFRLKEAFAAQRDRLGREFQEKRNNLARIYHEQEAVIRRHYAATLDVAWAIRQAQIKRAKASAR